MFIRLREDLLGVNVARPAVHLTLRRREEPGGTAAASIAAAEAATALGAGGGISRIGDFAAGVSEEDGAAAGLGMSGTDEEGAGTTGMPLGGR